MVDLSPADLPRNRFVARDIRLLHQFFLPSSIHWDARGRWMRIGAWRIPRGRYQYNVTETPVLIMVPEAYGERRGHGAGLEEFYVRRDLRLLVEGRWRELPHSYSSVDRRDGEVLARGWRYLCVHTDWDPDRDTVMTALTQLGLVFADPFAFERLARANGGFNA